MRWTGLLVSLAVVGLAACAEIEGGDDFFDEESLGSSEQGVTFVSRTTDDSDAPYQVNSFDIVHSKPPSTASWCEYLTGRKYHRQNKGPDSCCYDASLALCVTPSRATWATVCGDSGSYTEARIEGSGSNWDSCRKQAGCTFDRPLRLAGTYPDDFEQFYSSCTTESSCLARRGFTGISYYDMACFTRGTLPTSGGTSSFDYPSRTGGR